ncbi:hypothetical protein COEX109129_04995 [Corallococcus exiguus]
MSDAKAVSTHALNCTTPRPSTTGPKFFSTWRTEALASDTTGRKWPSRRITVGTCTANWRKLPSTTP